MTLNGCSFRWNRLRTKLYLNGPDRTSLAVIFEEPAGWFWQAWPGGGWLGATEGHATPEAARKDLLEVLEAIEV